jgi:hypothetical protein
LVLILASRRTNICSVVCSFIKVWRNNDAVRSPI